MQASGAEINVALLKPGLLEILWFNKAMFERPAQGKLGFCWLQYRSSQTARAVLQRRIEIMEELGQHGT